MRVTRSNVVYNEANDPTTQSIRLRVITIAGNTRVEKYQVEKVNGETFLWWTITQHLLLIDTTQREQKNARNIFQQELTLFTYICDDTWGRNKVTRRERHALIPHASRAQGHRMLTIDKPAACSFDRKNASFFFTFEWR